MQTSHEYSDDTPTACFSVHARAQCRVLQGVVAFLVERNLLPSRWHATAGSAYDELHIDIQIDGVDSVVAEGLARGLTVITDVKLVLVSQKRSICKAGADHVSHARHHGASAPSHADSPCKPLPPHFQP